MSTRTGALGGGSIVLRLVYRRCRGRHVRVPVRLRPRIFPRAASASTQSVAPGDEVVAFTANHGIAYLPWLPLRRGRPAQMRAVNTWAGEFRRLHHIWSWHGCLSAPNIIPIPGTSAVGHLEENLAAQNLVLPPPQSATCPGPIRNRGETMSASDRSSEIQGFARFEFHDGRSRCSGAYARS